MLKAAGDKQGCVLKMRDGVIHKILVRDSGFRIDIMNQDHTADDRRGFLGFHRRVIRDVRLL